MRPRPAPRPWAVLTALACAACGDDAAPRPTAGPTRPATRSVDEQLLELAELGYFDVAREPAPEPDRSGLERAVAGRCSPGYTMIVSFSLARADLVDIDGEVVRSWSDPESLHWKRAELHADGRLAVLGKMRDQDENPGQRYLAVYGFGGELLWRREMPVHHDVTWTTDGGLMSFTVHLREPPGGPGLLDNPIARLSPTGEILEEHSLLDLLSSAPELFAFDGTTRHVLGLGAADVLHANSIEVVDRPHPLFESGQVLVSIRHQDLIAAFDLDDERLVWAYGPGELHRQHEATVLENGNVLAFDNGGDERPWSRIVEIDPVAGEIAWEYRADPPESFYSKGRGTAQGLPGGNVLVANSHSGEVFEVTREGEVVWRYLSRATEGRRAVVRAFRYPVELVDRLLRESSIR